MEEFRPVRTPKEQAGTNLSGKRTVPGRNSGEIAYCDTKGVCGLRPAQISQVRGQRPIVVSVFYCLFEEVQRLE